MENTSDPSMLGLFLFCLKTRNKFVIECLITVEPPYAKRHVRCERGEKISLLDSVGSGGPFGAGLM